ncbi:MAG TPA: hypothetical protein V6C78_25350 [Crinalium sp.]|jgi:tetratricopeptide (TPR) repeat protein
MKTDTPLLSWYPVPDDVKQLLKLASDHWADTATADRYMHEALAIASDNPDVLVAAYRYFFYKNNNAEALQIANRVVDQIRASEQLPEQWAQIKPILIERKQEPTIRLFLNAYAASGLVLARLGELEKATEITAQVSEIDDRREFGASTIFDVLTRPQDDDD